MADNCNPPELGPAVGFAHATRAAGLVFLGGQVGADETGRGCLAGPLVAAAVCLDVDRLTGPRARPLARLNDSKQQSHASRAALYPIIMRLAVRVAIVSRCAPGTLRVRTLAPVATISFSNPYSSPPAPPSFLDLRSIRSTRTFKWTAMPCSR